MNLPNFLELSEEDLNNIINSAHAELNKRTTLREAQGRADQAAEDYARAVGDQPAREYTPGMVIGPGVKIIERGVEWVNDSHSWLSSPPSQTPLYYRMTSPPESNDVLPFTAGEWVDAGELRSRNGVVYKVVQRHQTAEHYAPDLVGMYALWVPA